jgi:alpha-beta hydrolase superfamily lysophospholipase
MITTASRNQSKNLPFEVSRLRLLVILVLSITMPACTGGPPLEPWHKARLHQEFTSEQADEVITFADYLALEDRLYAELDREVIAEVPTGPAQQLVRYSSGSAADPRDDNPDWNRSFELTPAAAHGHVLLLHGMSDSPYSLRALGLALQASGYHVLGLRLPGHGTIPAGIKDLKSADLIAAVRLAVAHLARQPDHLPFHIVGYSTGATLALDYTLDAMSDDTLPVPASLVLLSPAIGVHPVAGLAGLTDTLSAIPGLGSLAWADVMHEFDPYKYNSFPTNAADVVYKLTLSVKKRLARRAKSSPDFVLPPVLVFKSAVDATVSTNAVVDNLLSLLEPYRHRLVLFDVNRIAARKILLTADPGPINNRLLNDESLPFSVIFIGNANEDSFEVVARHKAPFSGPPTDGQSLGLEWPPYVVSLSHVGVPFAADDPLYGSVPPTTRNQLYLGNLALRGERGLSSIPAEWVMRMRYNPFYEIVEEGTIEWIDSANKGD